MRPRRRPHQLANGDKVAVADIDEARLCETTIALAHTGTVLAVVIDVSRKEEVEVLVAAAVDKFGGIDIMGNNADIAMVQCRRQVDRRLRRLAIQVYRREF